MKKDSPKVFFDPKQRVKVKPAGSNKQDARSAAYKTTPVTSNGLGAKSQP